MKIKTIQIVCALIWAGAIIACSIMIKDPVRDSAIRNVLIVAGAMNILLLNQRHLKKKKISPLP